MNRWIRLRSATHASEICEVCEAACVPKDVGNICVACLEAVPDYIPNEQIHKYINKGKT